MNPVKKERNPVLVWAAVLLFALLFGLTASFIQEKQWVTDAGFFYSFMVAGGYLFISVCQKAKNE